MKLSNGKHTVEIPDDDLNRDVWERVGFLPVGASAPSVEEPTYQELKSIAKDKGINTHGMKKEEILEALGM